MNCINVTKFAFIALVFGCCNSISDGAIIRRLILVRASTRDQRSNLPFSDIYRADKLLTRLRENLTNLDSKQRAKVADEFKEMEDAVVPSTQP